MEARTTKCTASRIPDGFHDLLNARDEIRQTRNDAEEIDADQDDENVYLSNKSLHFDESFEVDLNDEIVSLQETALCKKMANINAINIHQFFDIQPDANGNLWAICFYCLGGPYRMRHAQHFGHLYSHSAACQATDLLNHALQSILNPAPFNAIAGLQAQVGGLQAHNGVLQGQIGVLQGQIGGLQAHNNNTINILRTQLIANGLQPQA